MLGLDINSSYLAFTEKELEDCKRFGLTAEWKQLRSIDCIDSSTTDAVGIFSPNVLWQRNQKLRKATETGLFIEEFRCYEKLYLYSKAYCCYDSTSNFLNVNSQALKKQDWCRAVLTLWKRILKFRIKEWILHLETEVSERSIKQLWTMNKLNED